MSTVIHALIQAATLDVEAAGLHWRVRRVSSADLLDAGAGAFLLTPPPVADESEAPAAAPAQDPAQIAKAARFSEAVLCAGIQAVSRDGVAWEALRVTRELRAESGTKGIVHLSSLPSAAVGPLVAAIMELSNDGGAASERLASFLGG